MSIESQFEREEQSIEDDLANGIISQQEYNNQMRELQRDYRAEAEDSAQQAYDNEMQNW